MRRHPLDGIDLFDVTSADKHRGIPPDVIGTVHCSWLLEKPVFVSDAPFRGQFCIGAIQCTSALEIDMQVGVSPHADSPYNL